MSENNSDCDTFFTTSSEGQNFFRFPASNVNPLNPGNISNLHKKVRDITPEWIEGLKLRFAKNLNVNRGVYAEWMMGNQIPVGARFGCAFGLQDYKSITKTPMFTFDTNPSSLASNFHFLYHPLPEIKIESKFQTMPYPKFARIANSTAALEYFDQQTTVSFNLYNPSPSSGKMTFGILHNFTKQLCGGVEIFSSWCDTKSSPHPHGEISVALAGRYSVKRYSVAATISTNVLDISLWHQPTDYLQIGTSFIFDQRFSKSVGAFCYQIDLNDAKVQGSIDSDFSVGCSYTS